MSELKSTGWIDVNKRVPELEQQFEQPVLMVVKLIVHNVLNNEVHEIREVQMGTMDEYKIWRNMYSQCFDFNKVTHWRPLPELPNE
jgi:hypothetical protein